jgi:hypothetical protein
MKKAIRTYTKFEKIESRIRELRKRVCFDSYSERLLNEILINARLMRDETNSLEHGAAIARVNLQYEMSTLSSQKKTAEDCYIEAQEALEAAIVKNDELVAEIRKLKSTIQAQHRKLKRSK